MMVKSLEELLLSPEAQARASQAVREAAARADRRRAVEQMNANFALEGFTPDEQDLENQRRYIEGELSLDQLLASAQDFARSAQAVEIITLSIVQPDDGEAALSHLAAGRPIYYCEDEYPDEMVREWPEGRRELVKVAQDGTILTARTHPKGARAAAQRPPLP